MNRWNIPKWLEQEILSRDKSCVYCGVSFLVPAPSRGYKPSWEHVINDGTIVTRENIARCCMSCNSSKGAKDLEVWLSSKYCERKQINVDSVSLVIREAIQKQSKMQALNPSYVDFPTSTKK